MADCICLGGGSIFLLPLGLKWLRESPRWLVSVGRYDEAERIVFECIGQRVNLRALSPVDIEKQTPVIQTLILMFGPGLRRRTIVLMSLVLGASVGTFFISNMMTTLMVESGWSQRAAIGVIGLGTLGLPLGDYLSSFVTDKGGRKNPIIVACLLLFFVCCAVGLTLSIPILFGLAFFVRCALSDAAIIMIWSYLAENYPTRIRSTASGIIFSTGRAVSAMAVLLAPFCYTHFGFLGINIINGLIFAVPAIFVMMLVEKTAQKSLEQIEQEILDSLRMMKN